ncbi:hypothetical protein GCM10028819_05300 [Spirosoma humi]
MNTRWIANPYYCYILSFGSVFFVYSWGWSEIYPTLSVQVIIFLFFSFGIAFVAGNRLKSKISYSNISTSSRKNTVVLAILLGYCLEFLYNGGIPLILLLRGIRIEYMEFGIPTFHVALHTFSGFYTVYLFHQYISSKQKVIFFQCLFLLVPNILVVNRGALIMTLCACLILYLFSIKKILLKKIILLFVIAILFFYGFGYLGNRRSFNGDSLAFPRLTQATDDFIEGNIPKEYYWFYIYASSPIANFQNATISNIRFRNDIAGFVAWEILPDFISKRIIPIEKDYDGLHRTEYSINPLLTVGSIYFEPFIRIGWYGPIVVFLYYIIFIYIYLYFFNKDSRYYLSAIAILCAMSVFNIFENMMNFSGLIFQLVFPFILSKIEKYKIRFYGFTFTKINIRYSKVKFRF